MSRRFRQTSTGRVYRGRGRESGKSFVEQLNSRRLAGPTIRCRFGLTPLLASDRDPAGPVRPGRPPDPDGVTLPSCSGCVGVGGVGSVIVLETSLPE